MTWGAVGGAVAGTLVSGLLTGGGGSSSGTSGQQAAQGAADPFASQRPQYQQQLAALMSNPNSFQMSAAAQATEKQGMDAESAAMASRGLSSSGNEKIGLEQYAQGFASNQYQQQIADLMTLSGASTGNPGMAGNIANGNVASNNQAIGTISSTLCNAGASAFTNWLNGPSSTPAVDNTVYSA